MLCIALVVPQDGQGMVVTLFIIHTLALEVFSEANLVVKKNSHINPAEQAINSKAYNLFLLIATSKDTAVFFQYFFRGLLSES